MVVVLGENTPGLCAHYSVIAKYYDLPLITPAWLR